MPTSARVSRRTSGGPLALTVALTMAAGCTAPESDDVAAPDQASVSYYVDPELPEWIDPETGYDTTREWDLEGGEWPICLVMSPSQSPQAVVGFRDGIFQEALEPHGIDPVLERIELPPRTFRALERSKWPFVYMPIAVFMDFCRAPDNQGGAGGLQYVGLAGSTAGGGYTLITLDPDVESVADLAGGTVAQFNSNPVPAVLMRAAARQVGLEIGDGSEDIDVVTGPGGEQLNAYEAGAYDGIISLNILKDDLIARGSRVVTDFSDVHYTPNYTVLAVERTVYEERPEVVEAFLRAHHEAHLTALEEWDTTLVDELYAAWNGYFEAEVSSSAEQRIVPDVAAYRLMLGDMYPEDLADKGLFADCFSLNSELGRWGWGGTVDVDRLTDFSIYDTILEGAGG